MLTLVHLLSITLFYRTDKCNDDDDVPKASGSVLFQVKKVLSKLLHLILKKMKGGVTNGGDPQQVVAYRKQSVEDVMNKQIDDITATRHTILFMFAL